MIKELKEKLAKLHADARAIMKAADERKAGGGEGLTAEESAKVDAIYDEADKVKVQLDDAYKAEQRTRRADDLDQYMRASAGRRSQPEQPAEEAAPTLQLRGQNVDLSAASPLHRIALPSYRRAFGDYLLNGVPSAALQTSSGPSGGYTVPVQQAAGLLTALDDAVTMRQLATVLPALTVGASLGIVSIDTDPADADWTAEIPASDLSADTTMAFGKRELTPQLLTKYIEISMKLLRASSMNPEQIVNQRLTYKFAITENKAFLTGDGAKQPLGVFVASDDGVSTSRDTTCAATTAFTADEVIDTFYALKEAYQRNAIWLAHRDWVKRVRKLKGGDGHYLWEPGLNGGQQATILGRPVMMDENAPNTFSASQYVAIVGDFKAGYYIVDSLQMEFQRLNELKALQNKVGIVGRKETDGMPVLAEAFSRMKLAAG